MTRYLTRVHTFWCDAPECNRSVEENGTAREAWAFARHYWGWRMRDGKHFCPKHAKAETDVSEEASRAE